MHRNNASPKKKTKRNKRLRIWTAVLAVLLTFFAVFGFYVGDYYHADEAAVAAYRPQNGVTASETEDGALVFTPERAKAGLIFYPGGKVEYTAYVPLMEACAERGVLCVLPKMPFNLAFFDLNAANGVPERCPSVERWYIGGHSLGGVAAAEYLSDHAASFSGLILLASYSTADLSHEPVAALSVVGSEDGVLNRKQYEKQAANLPAATTEIVLKGGNHAFFGVYGPQKGDGEASLSNEEQIVRTADAIAAFCSASFF